MAAGADILVEVRFERGAEFRQVQAAVDTAELVIGFEHPGGAPAQRHSPVPPSLDVLGVLPANLDHGLDGGWPNGASMPGWAARPAAGWSASRPCPRAGWRRRRGESCPT